MDVSEEFFNIYSIEAGTRTQIYKMIHFTVYMVA